MKRILIVGKDSYIGIQVAAWLAKTPEAYQVETLDVRGNGWQSFDFTGYDAAILVAGIAHLKETPENEPLYEAVNHQLAALVAQKAKRAGVKQFVFFSSMSIYGLTIGYITADTQPNPNTAYGHSKYRAEQTLQSLADDTFHMAVLRPPMIYGKGCKGNYPKLSGMIQKLPVFPRVKNERSMLYIETLCAFIEQLLLSGAGGFYYPQNANYVQTSELAAQIALAHGKRLWQPSGFGWPIALLSKQIGIFGKLFGSLTYDQRMSDAFRGSDELSFAETIYRTEAEQ